MWSTNSPTLIMSFTGKKKTAKQNKNNLITQTSFSPFSDKMSTLLLLDWLYLCMLATLHSRHPRASRTPCSLWISSTLRDTFQHPYPFLYQTWSAQTSHRSQSQSFRGLLSRLSLSHLPTEDLHLLCGSFRIITFCLLLPWSQWLFPWH